MALRAGSAQTDITPIDSQFLFGYPHVERFSTGVHSPLLSSALYMSEGRTQVLFIANDIIFVSKSIAASVRRRISEATSIPAQNILISATHTHSGPITVDCLSNEADAVVPKADRDYLRLFEERTVEAGVRAHESARLSQVGLAVANGSCVGSNRHTPSGPADPDVPVLAIRSTEDHKPIALMLVCSMHPTVLHEDSTLVSADFPGMARQYLQDTVLGAGCPVLHHTGASGNQSPRHVTCANTLDEAERLGRMLGQAVESALSGIEYEESVKLACRQSSIDLPRRPFPSVEEAEAELVAVRGRLDQLRASNAEPAQVRTAECDWFGAEETLTLSRAAGTGRLHCYANLCMPAEVQLIKVGPWSFVGWPGEAFVEFGLQVKEQHKNTFVITLANGELQGYIVTADAVAQQCYEASNALFASPESGELLVVETLKLLNG